MLARKSVPESSYKFSALVPGLHIIANLQSNHLQLLQNHLAFKQFVEPVVKDHKLMTLGSVYYDFPSGGYTAVICLSESHLSIHTWPESGFIAFDVFLSNFKNNNRWITEDIYRKIRYFFDASVLQENFIDR